MIKVVVLFSLPGGLPVYAFSLLLTLGVLCGLFWVAWQAPPKEMTQRVDGATWVLLGALVGARAGYVAWNWPYFSEHGGEIFQVYLGGLAWPGAIAGGLATLILYCWQGHRPLNQWADALAPLLIAVSVSAWLGCWLDGCAYGATTTTWPGAPAGNEWGHIERRWPLQLVAALLTMGIFWLIEQYQQRLTAPAGSIASLSLAGVMLVVFAAGFLRNDPAPLWQGLRPDAWAALIFASLGLASLGVSYWKTFKAKWER